MDTRNREMCADKVYTFTVKMHEDRDVKALIELNEKIAKEYQAISDAIRKGYKKEVM